MADTARSLDLTALRSAYANGLAPTALVEEILARIAAYDDPAIWIYQFTREELCAHAARLE
jgi:allophanate hydrolase